MIRRPPRSTRTDTLCPFTTLFRSRRGAVAAVGVAGLAAVLAMSGLSPVDEAELRRLRWRCRRGMKELDQLLNRWLDQQWAASSEAQRGVFLQLLDCEDDRLWRWFLGHENAPDAALDALVQIGRALPPAVSRVRLQSHFLFSHFFP